MYYETTKELLAFIKKSPTAFHAVEEMQARLTEDGFQVLSEKEHWKLDTGREICGDAEQFCADRFFHSGKGIRKLSHHGQSQRFTVF